MKNPDNPSVHPVKAYKNLEFLNSPDARPIRVLCEFIEPGSRFRRLNVRDTIVFFGSARTQPMEQAQAALSAARDTHAKQGDSDSEAFLRRAEREVHMARYYEDASALAEKMTRWSLSLKNTHYRFIVCSGGGPGIMEAANRGAQKAGGPTIGLNISLPFEQVPNPYLTPELSFEFHYFFVRKFWFVYLAKALIVFPGGFGTLDEMFELLTLIQTGKTEKYMPVVIYGSEFWNRVLQFETLAEWGVISEEDLKLFRIVDDVDTAFEYLTSELTRLYL